MAPAGAGAAWAMGTTAVLASFPALPGQGFPAPLAQPDPRVPSPTQRWGWGQPSGTEAAAGPRPRPCAAASVPTPAEECFSLLLPQCVFDDLSGSVSLSWVGDSTGVRWAESPGGRPRGLGVLAPLGSPPPRGAVGPGARPRAPGGGLPGVSVLSPARCSLPGHPRPDHVPGALGDHELWPVQALPQVSPPPNPSPDILGLPHVAAR